MCTQMIYRNLRASAPWSSTLFEHRYTPYMHIVNAFIHVNLYIYIYIYIYICIYDAPHHLNAYISAICIWFEFIYVHENMNIYIWCSTWLNKYTHYVFVIWIHVFYLNTHVRCSTSPVYIYLLQFFMIWMHMFHWKHLYKVERRLNAHIYAMYIWFEAICLFKYTYMMLHIIWMYAYAIYILHQYTYICLNTYIECSYHLNTHVHAQIVNARKHTHTNVHVHTLTHAHTFFLFSVPHSQDWFNLQTTGRRHQRRAVGAGKVLSGRPLTLRPSAVPLSLLLPLLLLPLSLPPSLLLLQFRTRTRGGCTKSWVMMDGVRTEMTSIILHGLMLMARTILDDAHVSLFLMCIPPFRGRFLSFLPLAW